jgi:hypothetical protein
MEDYKKEILHSLIRPFQEDNLLVDICPRAKEVIHDTFLLSTTESIDYNWIKKSIQYTKNLPIYDKYTLRSYSYNGDLLINKYLRNNIIISTESIVFATQLFKLYDELSESYYTEQLTLSEEGNKKATEIITQYKLNIQASDVNIVRLQKVIDTYIQELRNIIINSPRCENDMIVFRGVEKDYTQSDLHVGNEDQKSRFLEPMLISNTYTRLSEKDEREFYQILLNYREKNIPEYLKKLYPEMKKQI